MIDKDFAQRFAQEWAEAWNSHDLDRILSHYTDDFEFFSPLIMAVTGDVSGRVRGKEQARAYWSQGLSRAPDLQFELLAVLSGINSIVIHYRGWKGVLAVELFYFNPEGKVSSSSAHYASRQSP